MPIRFHASLGLLGGAVDIALETGRTVSNSLYVCLAVALDCPLVTADEKLCAALASTGLSSRVVHVGEL